MTEIKETTVDKTSRITEIEKGFIELSSQHVDMVKMQNEMSKIQGDIAKQLLMQHEQIEDLLKALGLKKDLSEYSYNIFDGPAN